MKKKDFSYALPIEQIAQRPLAERDQARMLVLDRQTSKIGDLTFAKIPEILRGDELLVVNNARVLPVRLLGTRKGVFAEPHMGRGNSGRGFPSATIEALLLKEHGPGVWEALVRPGRKLRVGEVVVFGNGELEAEVTGRGDFGRRTLRFLTPGGLRAKIERIGHVPLPPYINRPDDLEDRGQYQTVFAKEGFAAACPTAGLHFTTRILERLARRGVEVCELTLNVGLGTFEPIRTEIVEQHKVHSETYEIPEETAEKIRTAKHQGRPVLAVGTTVVRALEDAAQKRGTKSKSPGSISAGPETAEIFIYPGHQFQIVDQLLTNFHLPESTLMVLVCAFAGKERVLAAYRHAVEEGYRFYSYGDCMLIR